MRGNADRGNKKSRINPRHIQPTIGNDEELNKMLGITTILPDGVLPNICRNLKKQLVLRQMSLSQPVMGYDNIHQALLPKNKKTSQ